MKKIYVAPLLIAVTLALAACGDDGKKTDLYGSGNGGALPNGSDQVDVNNPGGGIAPAARPDFNPDAPGAIDHATLAADTIYFDFDKATIPASERGKLEQVHQWMVANPGHSLFLAGNADKRGTPEYNRALGERRALAVREYLAALGLTPESLYTNSYGSDRPAVQGDTEEAYAKNRRVEVGVVQRP